MENTFTQVDYIGENSDGIIALYFNDTLVLYGDNYNNKIESQISGFIMGVQSTMDKPESIIVKFIKLDSVNGLVNKISVDSDIPPNKLTEVTLTARCVKRSLSPESDRLMEESRSSKGVDLTFGK